MLNDSLWIHAFANQLILDDETIRDHAVSQTKRHSLGALLYRGAKAVGFALRSYPRRHARQIRASHAEDVCVKTVCVNDINLVFFDVDHEPAKLFGEVQVVETCERIFMDLSNSKRLCVGT